MNENQAELCMLLLLEFACFSLNCLQLEFVVSSFEYATRKINLHIKTKVLTKHLSEQDITRFVNRSRLETSSTRKTIPVSASS